MWTYVSVWLWRKRATFRWHSGSPCISYFIHIYLTDWFLEQLCDFFALQCMIYSDLSVLSCGFLVIIKSLFNCFFFWSIWLLIINFRAFCKGQSLLRQFKIYSSKASFLSACRIIYFFHYPPLAMESCYK